TRLRLAAGGPAQRPQLPRRPRASPAQRAGNSRTRSSPCPLPGPGKGRGLSAWPAHWRVLAQHFAHAWRDLGAEQLDAGHELVVRQRAAAVLHVEAIEAERL